MSVQARARIRAGAVLAPAIFAVSGVASSASAQEAINTPAATQPSEGKLYLRQKLQFARYRDDPSPEDRAVDEYIATTNLVYGIARNLSASIDLPVVYSVEDSGATGETDRTLGTNDLALSFKWRPLQWDLSPVDSVRLAVFGGSELPTGSGDLGSHSFDPFVGAVVTAILGRHGFNQSLQYKFNQGSDEFNIRPGDGPADAVRYDTAYLFRLSPAEYTAETTAATYLTLELNGLYETNGDNEVLMGPGILYEARTFALEASLSLPILQDVDERPETKLVLTLGFRVLF
ncbi:MAG: hypothetical protein H7Y88_00540 [Phycisphaerales bacterium]|nr:hypothetical protein [Phycisphaerales bacterium]